MSINWKSIAQIKTQNYTGFCNGGWGYDAYPQLETLDAGKSIVIANIKGPAVITCIHMTQHFIDDDGLTEYERKAISARGIILEIYYNNVSIPAVKVPVGDFFADGCCGMANHFSSLFVEKAPESYNCFIPMPFEKSACILLRNETPYDLMNYSFVEYEQIPSWEDDIGYFHASWSRFAFQLHSRTDRHFFHIDGCGHLIGRAWSICTNEPYFNEFSVIVEGNNEIRIDNETEPRIDYLGTEDSFGFSWGFSKIFAGPYNGINFVQYDVPYNNRPPMLSVYRFYSLNKIRFNKSFDLRIDWSNEFTNNEKVQNKLEELYKSGRGWVDYATTYYWYQQSVGYEHPPLITLDQRCKAVLMP